MKSFVSLAVIAIFSAFTQASEPAIWTVSSRADVLRGDARNISIDSEGSIRLSPRLAEVFKTDQPYIWSSAFDAAGNVYLGTGGDGKVFKVAGGAGSLFADLAEMNVTALAVGRAGEIFAATSPDGKVYRIDQTGKPAVYFDAKEKYIWSLAIMGDGSLAVGTGESGKIYRVKTANATPESSLLFDTSDSHIICLTTDKAGNLYAGQGLAEPCSTRSATTGSRWPLPLPAFSRTARPRSSMQSAPRSHFPRFSMNLRG